MNRFITGAIAVFALTAATPPPAAIHSESAGPRFHEVLNWTVSNDRTIYIENTTGQWYRVDLVGPCDGLRTAFELALEASPAQPFDHATGVFTGGQSCPIRSMTGVAGPAIPPEEPFERPPG